MEILQFFEYGHLPPHLQKVSAPFRVLATELIDLPDNAERSVALRKLLESKDAAVRAFLSSPRRSEPRTLRNEFADPMQHINHTRIGNRCGCGVDLSMPGVAPAEGG